MTAKTEWASGNALCFPSLPIRRARHRSDSSQTQDAYDQNETILPTANYRSVVRLIRQLRHPREIVATMITTTAEGTVATAAILEATSDWS
jgi:hypothetical protein